MSDFYEIINFQHLLHNFMFYTETLQQLSEEKITNL